MQMNKSNVQMKEVLDRGAFATSRLSSLPIIAAYFGFGLQSSLS
jgi:hypothetical protein